MPSTHYHKLVSLVTPYIGEAKADGAIGRQLKHCNGTPDTFCAADYAKITAHVIGATSLYVRDPVQKQKLIDQLNTFS
ncbi:MAG: hypothetical protein EXS13_04675 [Planctomycetes bacterium]|nr:hypothetical protein [Planctomycetota bacterium]